MPHSTDLNVGGMTRQHRELLLDGHSTCQICRRIASSDVKNSRGLSKTWSESHGHEKVFAHFAPTDKSPARGMARSHVNRRSCVVIIADQRDVVGSAGGFGGRIN